MSITNVALAGATGLIGAHILKSLLEAGFPITVLSRDASKLKLDSHEKLKIVSVDYSSLDSLRQALTGIDAVVSAMGDTGLSPGSDAQSNLIKAAEQAGVKRFLPSEFGADYQQLSDRGYPYIGMFAGKLNTQGLLQQLSSKNPNFSYTLVTPGAFLDWGLTVPWLLVTGESEVRLVDDGHYTTSGTTLPSVAKAVAGVLLHPEETKNRSVYVRDAEFSQSQLLQLLRKIRPDKEWKITTETLTKIEEQIGSELSKPEPEFENIIMPVVTHFTFSHWSGRVPQLDNELLGLGPLGGEAKLEQILKHIFTLKK